MIRKIGIDAGGSLVKVSYQEQGKLHIKTFSNLELEKVAQWLVILAPDAQLVITGGKAGQLKNLLSNESYIVEEFHAVTNGTRYLLVQEMGILHEDFILVNIGTGTSIFHVKSDSFERILGSGIGGGTLMGLGHLITGKNDFSSYTAMAEIGDNRNSDLLVRDIYAPNEPPIFGDLTAANLGKVHLNEAANENDYLASVMQLIGETIILLAGQAAMLKQVSRIVFVGSTLVNNIALKNVLSRFKDTMSYEPIFLEKGSHAGAVGALID
ncbi:type II pantothenate kinase [Paucisalibacillus sp. EB02]|uniref:type II pantothenate kinase n=1 Tax=Paucisalibacillus sp. EB02 TaxID=1347087 RepID=UPI0004BA8838|nr:type II pantothenate kinase [Paucisalibacillus sp. EB02]